MSMFSRQLAAMLDAGIPVTQALSTLASQTNHQTLASSVRTIPLVCAKWFAPISGSLHNAADFVLMVVNDFSLPYITSPLVKIINGRI